MSSAPETDGDLTVTIKRVPGGLVSNWFHDHVAEGDDLDVTKPAGVFCAQDGERPVVAFCGGSGVTPVMSITKSVLATHRATGARALRQPRPRLGDLPRSSCEQLQAAPSRNASRCATTSTPTAASSTPTRSRRSPRSTLDADFYICGPTPFMDLVEATLLELGVDPDRIVIERFVNAGQAVPHGARARSRRAAATADATVPEAVTLILKGKRHEVAYQPGDTVLETARRGGLQAPFSCEAGNCATCMALVHEGVGHDAGQQRARPPSEVDEGWILTCQSIPQGQTVTVEYEDF